MLKSEKTKLLVAYGVLAISIGCTQKAADETSTASSKDLSKLSSVPNVSGPVVGAGSLGLSVSPFAATTGVKISAFGSATDWTSSTSRAFCEVGMTVKESMIKAMEGDLTLCQLGALQSAGKMDGVNVDSSDYVYFKMTASSVTDQEYPVKLKVVKVAGAISEMELFSCTESTQGYYTKAILNTSGASVKVKNVYNGGGYSFGSSFFSQGTLDANFNWTDKSLLSEQSFSYGSMRFDNQVTVKQNASAFSVSGYSKGNWTGGYRFSNAFYSQLQHLNSATPAELALGDGSAKYDIKYCNDGDNDGDCDGSDTTYYSKAATDSWNGDTRINLTDGSAGDYYATVDATAIPSVGSNISVAFSADEAWDCSADSFGSVDLNDMFVEGTQLRNLVLACDEKFQVTYSFGSWACQNAQ